MVVQTIPLSRIYCRRDRDRAPAVQGDGTITRLADSIMKLGLVQPLEVEATKGKLFRLSNGSLRLAAMRQICAREGIDRRDYMVQCCVDSEIKNLESERSEYPNLFPHQRKMIEELVKRGRMDGTWGRNVGKTAALNFAVQAQAVEVGNLHQAYQAEKRSHRIGHPWQADKYRSLLTEVDFAGVEIRVAQHYAEQDAYYTRLLAEKWGLMYGMTQEFFGEGPPSKVFDLGDTW